MPTAVQIGAGGIGRGFLGQLLSEGGYEVVFVDSDTSLVERLNTQHLYPLRFVSKSSSETVTVRGISALATSEAALVAQAIARADLVSVAVGTANLARAADLLAAGLALRGETSLDILLCENQRHAAALVRSLLEARLGHSVSPHIGLVETVIGRMVPRVTQAVRAEDPLLLIAEPYQELPISKVQMRGPIPTLPGLILAEDFESFEARKLYLHNMSHAALAYLGALRGHDYIWQCAADDAVLTDCRRAQNAVVMALANRSCFSQDELERFSANLMDRFANQALGDTVTRVAADPLRKLRPDDRLIGAANLCVNSTGGVEAFAPVIAAALRYDHPGDAAALTLQDRRRTEGDAAVLHSLCGLSPDTELSRRVLSLL
jgi:mannitol-1-phosphate 5-dehydrogenase